MAITSIRDGVYKDVTSCIKCGRTVLRRTAMHYEPIDKVYCCISCFDGLNRATQGTLQPILCEILKINNVLIVTYANYPESMDKLHIQYVPHKVVKNDILYALRTYKLKLVNPECVSYVDELPYQHLERSDLNAERWY